MNLPNAFRSNAAAVPLMSALTFFVLALRQDALFLVGTFLSLAGAGSKNRRQRPAVLAICLALAVLVAGYGLGKQLALRDAGACKPLDAAA